MAIVRNEYCPAADPLAAGDHSMQAGHSISRAQGVEAWILHYTLRGAARFHHSRGSFVAGAGELVAIEPGTPHRYGTEGGVTWSPLWVVFTDQPRWRELLAWPEMGPGHLRVVLREKSLRRQVEDKLRDTINLVAEVPRHRGALSLNALEAALLWSSTEVSPPGAKVWDPRLQRAVSYLHQNLSRQISLPEVAGASAVSAPHLTRLFRETLGISPGKYLERMRMDRARELLAYTSMNIQEVAESTGFGCPFYFSNRFRCQVGVSPRAYRQGRLIGKTNEE